MAGIFQFMMAVFAIAIVAARVGSTLFTYCDRNLVGRSGWDNMAVTSRLSYRVDFW